MPYSATARLKRYSKRATASLSHCRAPGRRSGSCFVDLGKERNLPALFHCTTGKDRTGWAAAALLSLLGVPEDVIFQDYLRSNDYPPRISKDDRRVHPGGRRVGHHERYPWCESRVLEGKLRRNEEQIRHDREIFLNGAGD